VNIYMNIKTITLSVSMLTVGALLAGIVSGTALAYRGDPNVQGPNYTPERHEAMEKAFESNDYNAWKNLMQGKGRVTQVINESNFAKFAQVHQLMEEGKTVEAQALRQELGLGLKNGSGQGNGQGFGRGMHTNQ